MKRNTSQKVIHPFERFFEKGRKKFESRMDAFKRCLKDEPLILYYFEG